MMLKFRSILLAGLSLAMLSACQKAAENVKDRFGANAPKDQFVDHLIALGSHNSDKNAYKPVNTQEMKFVVKFDNSAVYSTANPANQGDINKLYGFSDNNQDHHTNSARIGWRWFDNQLQLFAYVYNNTVQTEKLVTAVSLNQEVNCSIRVQGDQYIFSVNGITVNMPRASATPQAVGYQLYPYFGGDETAPQPIRIAIKDL